MKRLISIPKNLHWVNTEKYIVEVCLSDESAEVIKSLQQDLEL